MSIAIDAKTGKVLSVPYVIQYNHKPQRTYELYRKNYEEIYAYYEQIYKHIDPRLDNSPILNALLNSIPTMVIQQAALFVDNAVRLNEADWNRVYKEMDIRAAILDADSEENPLDLNLLQSIFPDLTINRAFCILITL